MAPLRSSRSTRHQEHNVVARNRAGAIDWDPTEGLPVRKWERITTRVNQDASADPADGNSQGPQHGVNDFPWPELPLPTFFSQLPPYSQELLRRARMGNTNVTPSEWDRKTKSWIPGSEVEARNARLKSKHLLTVPDSPNSHEENDNEEDNDDLFDADGLPTKRRKANTGIQERVIEIKKWAPIDPALAEKLPEPKYLADRRAGMESLYGGAYKATNGFGTLGLNPAAGSGAVGFDSGDGSGLASAPGVPGSTGPAPESTPVRRNMPPKRKKKKLGGPGRKKANPTAAGQNTPNVAPEDVVMTDTPTGDGAQPATQDGLEDTHPEGDVEGSESESEGEGSEEGEIEEVAKPESPATAPNTHTQGDISNTEPQGGLAEVESGVETAETTAHSDVAAVVTLNTEIQQATSSEALPSEPPIEAETARQQAAMPITQSEQIESETTATTTTTEIPITGAAVPPPTTAAESETNANSEIPNKTEATADPELVLKQVPLPNLDPQVTVGTEPTPENVRIEDAGASTFEQIEQREAQDQATQEPTHTDVDDARVLEEAQPEKAPTPTQTTDQAILELEPQQVNAEEQIPVSSEVDLLDGLEAAVEKEHQAM